MTRRNALQQISWLTASVLAPVGPVLEVIKR